jgi:uncharacterized protein YecE (DUF72 family)
MAIRIGTSGFIHEHWRRRFYPPSARGSELELYARTFDTVELNVTFYRMPPSATFRSWAARVPDGFLFAVKASRYLTHVLRLREPRSAVALLVERAGELGAHLGPILIQLPPDLELDHAALEATLEAFAPGIRLAVEPRHRSWFVDDIRRLLTDHNAALCVVDSPCPRVRTAFAPFKVGRSRPPLSTTKPLGSAASEPGEGSTRARSGTAAAAGRVTGYPLSERCARSVAVGTAL